MKKQKFRQTYSVKTQFFALVLLAFSFPQSQAQESWAGWYGGIIHQQQRTDLDTRYTHQHYGGCTNLNFGSEWPGDGCEGNQNFNNRYRSSQKESTFGLRLSRLWQSQQWVTGVYLNLGTGSNSSVIHHQLLSRTWGDHLELNFKTGPQLGVGGIIGVAKGDWLPYASLGLEMKQVKVHMTQDQPGYDQTSVFQTSEWARGYGFAIGFQRRLSPDWSLHAQYEVKDLGEVKLHRPGYLAAYGLTYPDTQIRTRLAQSGLQIGVSKKF